MNVRKQPMSPEGSDRSCHSLPLPSSTHSTTQGLQTEMETSAPQGPSTKMQSSVVAVPIDPPINPSPRSYIARKRIKIEETSEEVNLESESESDEEETTDISMEGIRKLLDEQVNESDVLKSIERVSKTEISGKVYSLTNERVKTFARISKLLDSQCKTRDMQNGFLDLFSNGPPNVMSQWNEMNVNVPMLSSVPIWLYWILVYMSLCFGSFINNKVIEEELSKTVKKFVDTGFAASNIIPFLKSFTKHVNKIVRKERGDYIEEGIGPSPVNHPVPATVSMPTSDHVKQSTSKNTEYSVAVSLSSDRSHYLPPPPPPLQSSRKKISSMKKKSTTDQTYSGSESKAGTQSDTSSVSRKKRRRCNMDEMTQNYTVKRRSPSISETTIFREPDVSNRSCTENGRRVTFNEERPKLRDVLKERPRYSPPQEFNQSRQSHDDLHDGPVFDVSKIHFNRRIPQKNYQKMLASIGQNKYVVEATRYVVATLISKGQVNPDCIIEFGDVMKSFVKKITSMIFGSISFSLQDMIQVMSDNNDDQQEKEAVHICGAIISLIRFTGDDIVSISWRALMDWIKEFSKLLTDEIIRISFNKSGQNPIQDITHEAIELRNNLESEIRRKHGHLLNLFEKLSNVSDLCLYILFGLNITKTDTQTLFTDLTVTTIMQAWKAKGHFPTRYEKVDVFWSLPLGHLIELNGFGEINVTETELPISLEEFFEESMKLDAHIVASESLDLRH